MGGEYICLYVLSLKERVDFSMVVICYASDIIEYDRRRSELSNAPLHMKQDNDNIE